MKEASSREAEKQRSKKQRENKTKIFSVSSLLCLLLLCF
jgi:hypothetical protein